MNPKKACVLFIYLSKDLHSIQPCSNSFSKKSNFNTTMTNCEVKWIRSQVGGLQPSDNKLPKQDKGVNLES
jgi:hypothetical protein